MRRLSLVLICLVLALNETSAHDPNKAFFFLSTRDSGIYIEAEFPWTLRDALIHFDPTLKQATSPKAFHTAFERYLSSHLLLQDEEGKNLKFLEWQSLDDIQEMHQSTYLLRYEKGKIARITNRMMFNVFPTQSNFHQFVGSKDKKFLVTDAQHPTLILIEKKNNVYGLAIIAGILLAVAGIIILTTQRKKAHTPS